MYLATGIFDGERIKPDKTSYLEYIYIRLAVRQSQDEVA